MIVVRIWEGLGNQLFQYAYARALEMRTGKRVYFDTERCFSAELEGKRTVRPYELGNLRAQIRTRPDIATKFWFLGQRNIFEKFLFWMAGKDNVPIRFVREKDVSYKEELKTITKTCYLMGWFQNENYFKEYRDILIKELKPRSKIRITEQLKYNLRHENTVSVHIRRGDYKKWNYMLPVSYYERAIEYMRNRIDVPYFIVFSDDIKWVKEHIDLGKDVYFASEEENLEAYEELFVMSRCKHHIIANSTFSWWGAWLDVNPEKIVVGPRNWFDTRGMNAGYNIMPADWVKL